MTKKITRTTFKSFIKKNEGKLYIENNSKFDGMTDGIESCEGGFTPVVKTDRNTAYTLGIQGAWLVGHSRDWFSAFSNDQFEGIHVSNCCGSFTVAVAKSS